MRTLSAGEAVLLLATDPTVEPDVHAFCGATGHQLLALEVADGEYRAHLRKSAG